MTVTVLGKRCLEYIILNPMVQSKEIEKYYDMVAQFSTLTCEGDVLWVYVEKKLRGLPDVARLQRKLELKIISPKELVLLLKAYQQLLHIILAMTSLSNTTLNTCLFQQFDVMSFNTFVDDMIHQIDLNQLDVCQVDQLQAGEKRLSFDGNPFVDQLVDQFHQLDKLNEQLQLILNHLNGCLNKDAIRVEVTHMK